MNKKAITIFFAVFAALLAFSCSGPEELEYQKTETNNYVFKFPPSSNFSVDGEYVKASVKQTEEQKKKNIVPISNWRLNCQENNISLSLTDVYGFEAKVKCDSNMNFAAMQWLNIQGFKCYYFEVHPDGSFKVRYDNQDSKPLEVILNLTSENSHVIIDDFNTIALVPKSNSNFDILVNGYIIGTILQKDLKIIPGPIAFAACPKAGKTGNAWFKFLSYSQLK